MTPTSQASGSISLRHAVSIRAARRPPAGAHAPTANAWRRDRLTRRVSNDQDQRPAALVDFPLAIKGQIVQKFGDEHIYDHRLGRLPASHGVFWRPHAPPVPPAPARTRLCFASVAADNQYQRRLLCLSYLGPTGLSWKSGRSSGAIFLLTSAKASAQVSLADSRREAAAASARARRRR